MNGFKGWGFKDISLKEKTVLTVPAEEASSKTVISFASLKAATDYRAYLLVDGNHYRIGDFSTPKIEIGKELLGD